MDDIIMENMAKLRQKMEDDIVTDGFAMIGVMGAVPFTYSIGIYETTGQPEIIIFGSSGKVAATLIHDYYRKVRDGEKFTDFQKSDAFLIGYDVVFRDCVGKDLEDEYAVQCFYRYERLGKKPPTFVQMVLPDVGNKFPWEDGCDPKFVVHQDNGIWPKPIN